MNIQNLDYNKLNETLSKLSVETEIRTAKINFLKENGHHSLRGKNLKKHIQLAKREYYLREVK